MKESGDGSVSNCHRSFPLARISSSVLVSFCTPNKFMSLAYKRGVK